MTTDPIRILVLDDEESIRWVIGKTLDHPAFLLSFAGSAEEAARIVEQDRVDFALVDINLPGDDGLSFLEQQKQSRPELVIAVITGQGTMRSAITAMKLGAFDYLTKPFDIDELESLVKRATQAIRQTRRHATRPPSPLRPEGEADLSVGRSRSVREIYKAIGRVADSELTVLILGESGTGKELIARAIHQHSRRADQPFVAVNCAAIPRDLLEAELFGYEKGAFTGAVERKAGRLETASGGTLFLDEIGDMPLDLQAKLLRVLQEREFQRLGGLSALRLDARILTATNQELEHAVQAGRFRADLYYRINAFIIQATPLRDRREDIPALAEHFLRRAGTKLGMAPPAITPEALARLEHHDWPGNVRELENVIKSLIITVRGPVIDVDDLPRNLPGGEQSPDLGAVFEHTVLQAWQHVIREYCARGHTGLLHQVETHLERPLIRQVLMETNWNQVRTARVLGINRNTLRTKMQALGIGKRVLPASEEIWE